MSEARQLPLDLGYRPALGREDFFVSPANSEAVAWVDRWPDWPVSALVVVGPPGSGKSHLGAVWRACSQADVFPGAAEQGDARAYLVEDVDELTDDIALFHLYNRVAAAGGHVMFTARTPPAHWGDRLPDIVSRLKSLPTVSISLPDDTLIAAVLVKQFSDRQLHLNDDVIAYLLPRMERSFDSARRLVAAIDEAALAEGRRITVSLARRVLDKHSSGV